MTARPSPKSPTSSPTQSFAEPSAPRQRRRAATRASTCRSACSCGGSRCRARRWQSSPCGLRGAATTASSPSGRSSCSALPSTSSRPTPGSARRPAQPAVPGSRTRSSCHSRRRPAPGRRTPRRLSLSWLVRPFLWLPLGHGHRLPVEHGAVGDPADDRVLHVVRIIAVGVVVRPRVRASALLAGQDRTRSCNRQVRAGTQARAPA